MREHNYYEGHPRAQAATDAAIGAVGGTILGAIAGTVIAGTAAVYDRPGIAVGGLFLPIVGGLAGAWMMGKRARPGFSAAQSQRAGRGAAIGGLFGLGGAAAGTFYATERASNPKVRSLKNGLMR